MKPRFPHCGPHSSASPRPVPQSTESDEPGVRGHRTALALISRAACGTSGWFPGLRAVELSNKTSERHYWTPWSPRMAEGRYRPEHAKETGKAHLSIHWIMDRPARPTVKWPLSPRSTGFRPVDSLPSSPVCPPGRSRGVAGPDRLASSQRMTWCNVTRAWAVSPCGLAGTSGITRAGKTPTARPAPSIRPSPQNADHATRAMRQFRSGHNQWRRLPGSEPDAG